VTIAQWDAVETAERIRRGEVKPGEVIEAAIARAEAAADLGAIVTSVFDLARERAAPPAGVFAGVPTFVKDLSQIRGVRTAWGSAASGDFISPRSDPFVKKFARTGVVMLGKSATPELGLTATTEPLFAAPTRNPRDRSRSPGGSSGGAGALVAAGVVPIAHGSDGGGSIRIPAACCGVVGFKPSRGRLDMEGSRLLPVNVAVHGVITRSLRDTIAFHQAVAGLGEVAPAPTRALRIGVFSDAPGGTPVDPEVRAAVAAAAETCAALGHEVAEISCPFDGQLMDDFLAYWGFVAWIQVKSARVTMHRGFDRARIEPWTAGLAESFARDRRRAFGAMRRLRRFGRSYARVMERCDLLLSPTLAQPAPPLGYLATDHFETHFERLRAYAAFTPAANAAGAPAISLPLAVSASGLPIGVHFSARRHDDRTLLELAQTLYPVDISSRR
jgi:amidase